MPAEYAEIIGVAIPAVASVLVVVIPLWFKVKNIDTQVSNSHEENFRDEVTRGFREIRDDIRSLSRQLDTERIERIEGDRRKDVT